MTFIEFIIASLFLFKVNANGSVMSSDIVGSIKLKTMLSGMPELRLGLNDRVLFALSGRTPISFLRLFSSRKLNGITLHFVCFVLRWQGENGHDGGCEVPSVRASVTLWERSNNLLHSSRWRVWTDVLSHQYSCKVHLFENEII